MSESRSATSPRGPEFRSPPSRGWSTALRGRASHGDRVRQVIDDLGYESSLVARSLRSRRTNVIAVLVSGIEPFSAELLKGAARAAGRHRLRTRRVLGRHDESTAAGSGAIWPDLRARSPTASSSLPRPSHRPVGVPDRRRRPERRRFDPAGHRRPELRRRVRRDPPPARPRAPSDRLPRRALRPRVGAPPRSRVSRGPRPGGTGRRATRCGGRVHRAVRRRPRPPPAHPARTTDRGVRGQRPDGTSSDEHCPRTRSAGPSRSVDRRLRQHPRGGAQRPTAHHRRPARAGARTCGGAGAGRPDRTTGPARRVRPDPHDIAHRVDRAPEHRAARSDS